MNSQPNPRELKGKFLLRKLFLREGRLRPTLRILLTLVLSFVSSFVFSTLFGLAILFLAGKNTLSFTTIFNLAYIGQALGVILAIIIARKYLDQRRIIDLGLHRSPGALPDLVFGIILGAGLQLLIFLVHFFCGWIIVRMPFSTLSSYSIPTAALPANTIAPTAAPAAAAAASASTAATPGALALMLVVFILIAVNEELLVRGYVLQNLTEAYGKKAATLVSSVLFGVLHLSNANASFAGILNIALSGILFAVAYWVTNSLYLPIGLHFSWNFFLGPVFGYPVSGILQWPSIINTTVIGPELWTGGAFGPEAGLTGLFAILVGIAIVFAWADWRKNWIPKKGSTPPPQPVRIRN